MNKKEEKERLKAKLLEELCKDDVYPMTKQGPGFNNFFRMRLGLNNLDTITNNASKTENGLTVFIEQFSELSIQSIRASCHRLFEVILMIINHEIYSIDDDKTITFPLQSYMKVSGLSDTKASREQVLLDLEILFRCRLSFVHAKKKYNFVDLRLCVLKGISNSRVYFKLTDEFYKIIKKYPVMPFPVFVLRTPLKSNPNSYYLAKRIFEHIRMNYNKPNANIIGVHTLLKACPNLQKYNEEKRKTQIIIDPFERDMDKNNDNIQWEYCNKLGVKLPDEKMKEFTFDVFLNSYIKFSIPKYPIDGIRKIIGKQKTKSKKSVKNKRC